MKKNDLAVIVPVYNGEGYIERCINSILSNKCKIQLIIVNDGSTDNTVDIIKKYDAEIINLKTNKGVSYSRNIGLEHVKAKYYTFVDSDDYLSDNCYPNLLKIMEENKLDLVGFNYYEESKKVIKSKYHYSNKLYDNEEIIKDMLKNKISYVVWNKIYKTDVFSKIKFNENLKYNEDYLYTIEVLSNTNKSIFLDNYLYFYCQNNSSLSHNYIASEMLKNDFISNLNEDAKKKLMKYDEYEYFEGIQMLKLLHLYSKCKKNRYKYIKKYVDRKKIKKLLNYDINIATRIEILIYLFSIRLHIIFFPIYMKLKDIIRK